MHELLFQLHSESHSVSDLRAQMEESSPISVSCFTTTLFQKKIEIKGRLEICLCLAKTVGSSDDFLTNCLTTASLKACAM